MAACGQGSARQWDFRAKIRPKSAVDAAYPHHLGDHPPSALPQGVVFTRLDQARLPPSPPLRQSLRDPCSDASDCAGRRGALGRAALGRVRPAAGGGG